MMENKNQKKKALNMKKMKMFEQQKKPRHNCVSWHHDTIVYPDTILKNKKKYIYN